MRTYQPVIDNRRVLIFADYEQMTGFAVEKWTALASAAIRHKDCFTVALSGGTTPIGFYQKLSLCNKNVAWDKVHIFLADERFVPFDDEASNYRMIKENLLDRIAIPETSIHPISTRESTSERSAHWYEEHLRDFFKLRRGELPSFDLIMLGIGEDGHIASLFPGTSSVSEKARLAVAVTHEKVSNERISLSLPVINSAKTVIFLVSGTKKAPVVKKILEHNNDNVPAARVRPERGKLYFLVDKDAGQYLSQSLR